MVMVRKAIEKTYTGLCTIYEKKKVLNDNMTTSFIDVVVLENEPCKLSFSGASSADKDGVATSVSQNVKVFIAPEINIKPSSKLSITQNNVTTDYVLSGEPALYNTHQEIALELAKEWA